MYKKHKRTKDKVTIEVERFYIDGIPVCCAWWCDEKHPRMMCRFYGARGMGFQPVCLMTGEDLHETSHVLNRVPDTCTLHKNQKHNGEPNENH